MIEVQKCNKDIFCKGFKKISYGMNYADKRTGIYESHFIDVKTGDISKVIPVIKFKDSGKIKSVALNFCPICGESFKSRLD